MNAVAFSIAYTFFRAFITPRVFDKIGALVAALEDEDAPGLEKKARVIDFVLTYASELADRFGGMWKIMLDGIIFFVRAKTGAKADE